MIDISNFALIHTSQITMFIDDDQEIMRRFYTDITNSAVFGTPVKYLQKYEQIHDYAIIAHSEEEVLRLMFLVVSRDLDKPSKISEMLTEEGVDQSVSIVLAGIAANKYADIRRQLLRREICRGGPCLLDHNWRIVNILSTNWTAAMLIVEQQGMGPEEKRINLELDVHEVEQLINKLKEIKRSLKS